MDYAAIWAEAKAAGYVAGIACTPKQMVVGQYVGENIRVVDIVDEGMCGFAWVKVRPANNKMARWLKHKGEGYKAYDGGWDVSIHEFGQSWERKTAAAVAMAAVLRSHGINATAHDRID
jgi:hypothetical protein